MLFAIVSEHQEVSDPDSGQSLGRWESVKVRVIVTHVQERMCTVRSPLAEDDKAQATGTLSAMMVRHAFGIYGSRKESRPQPTRSRQRHVGARDNCPDSRRRHSARHQYRRGHVR